ncbi:MAG: membrane protein insertase YidC [Edaphocola sp.]
MDRNSIIGFVLLLAMAGTYFWWNNHEQQAYLAQKTADSIAMAAVQKPISAQQDMAAPKADTAAAPTVVDSSLPAAFRGMAEDKTIGNGLLTVRFNTKGGYPVQATLDSFKTYGGKPLAIFSGNQNKFSFSIPANGKTLLTDQLYYTPEVSELPGGGQHLRMTAEVAPGQKIVLDYSLPKGGYMLSGSLHLVGLGQSLASVQTIPLTWITEVPHTEKDLKNERMNMQVHYLMKDGEHDYFTVARTGSKSLNEPVRWMSTRSHFFNSTLIAEDAFKTASFDAKEPQADTNIVAANTGNFTIATKPDNDFSFGFQWYMGPNDYKLLKSCKMDLDELVQLGIGPFFFVKYISKWMIIPIFDFLSRFISSFGLIIICLTVIIRLLTSFFTYKSYLSTAKMRVLKPELDALRAKYGDNQQQFGMEQMKLYRTAGVNPLGGCLPMLLQMPFLLSVYYFIPTAIQLRQSHFLWSNDLSTYDSVFNLPFSIPFYGSHVSLFTLLMTVSSLLLAVYNRNMTPAATAGNDPNAQVMKYMPYIMPVVFLGWFNSMAAGLTFYYTFSNLLSMAQQFLINKFAIDETKIHAQIQENKKKPAGTSKWQQRLEELQKNQTQRVKQTKK